MPRKLTAADDARIATLHRGRSTEAQIATVLAREGIKITPSGVHRVLQRLGLAKPRKAAKAARAPHSAPVTVAPSAAPDVSEDDSDEDVPGRLRRVLSSLERAAKQAEADRDVGRLIAAQKAIVAASALLAKATPAPPPDVDARPDMVAAAKRGRERMHALLDRLLTEAS